MKLRNSCLVCALLLSAGTARADSPFSGNLALTSDYLFRGLSQTWGEPALQGGADYNSGRFHIGAWTSNVSRNSYPGGGIELDVFTDAALWQREDWNVRAGLYAYVYSGANLDHASPALPSRSLDTVEANVSLQWKHWTLKYSRALSDYFGADVEQGYAHDTRGTHYLQLDGDVPLSPRWSIHLHAGRTHYASKLLVSLSDGAINPDYADYSLAASYALAAHWSLIASLSHASNSAFYSRVVSFTNASAQKDLGGTRAVLSISTAF